MSNNARRKLLKSITAGSGAIIAGKSLPESWSRPVVDSVMLPAHAETSVVPLILTGSSSNNNASINGGDTGVIERVVSNFVPSASANGNCKPDEWTCYAEKQSQPLNEADGEWLLIVKQSKFKDGCDCPTKERVWEENVLYDSASGPGQSNTASTNTSDSCGMDSPDKDGKLNFKLQKVNDGPRIRIIKIGGKDIELNVHLFDGGSKPIPECCE